MELTTLSFRVETGQIENAVTQLDKLAVALKGVNAAGSSASGLDKLGKGASEAGSGLTQASEGAEKLNKPLKELPANVDKASKFVKDLSNRFNDLVDGFSRGEASQLKQARSLGIVGEEFEKVKNILKDTSSLFKDPFDATVGSIRSVTAEFDKLTARMSLNAQGLSLTTSQLEQYSRISTEVAGKIKQLGMDPKSGEGLARYNALLKETQADYLMIAASVNQTIAAEKQRNDILRQQEKVQRDNLSMMDSAVAQFRKLEEEKAAAAQRSAKKIVDANQDAINSAERLLQISKLMQEGMSQGEATKRVDLAGTGVELANIERLIAAEKELANAKNLVSGASNKQSSAMSESAKASAWLEREIARAEHAVEKFNDELQVSTSNRLFKFSEQLKKAGISGEEASRMMEDYRSTIVRGQTKTNEMMDKELRNLARAVSVQMGDVAVSLASGMNPFMIMIQQGDQLRGAFQQVDASAEQVRKSMTTAAGMIASSFIDTGKAIGGFFVGAFVSLMNTVADAGAYLGGPFTSSLNKMRTEMEAANAATGAFSTRLSIIKFAIMGVTASVALAVTAVAGFAIAASVAWYQVQKDTDEMNKALIMTGGALGLGSESAIRYASSFEAMGVPVSKAVGYLTEFAKSGQFTKSEISLLIPVVQNMNKQIGTSVEDAVKSFEKFKKDPVDALIELGKATGRVSAETIKAAIDFDEAGNKTAAVSLAISEAARVNQAAADQMKNDYSTLGTILNETSNAFSNFWAKVKGLMYKDSAVDAMQKQIKNQQDRVKSYENNPALKNSESHKQEKERLELLNKRLLKQIEVNQAEEINREQNAKDVKALEATKKLNKEISDQLDRDMMKTMTKSEFVDKFIAKKLEEAKIVGNTAALQTVEMDNLKKLAELEFLKTKTAKDGNKEQNKITTAFEAAMKRMIGLREEAAGKVRELTKAEIAYNEIVASKEWKSFDPDRKKQIQQGRDLAINEAKLQEYLKEEARIKKELIKYDDKRYSLASQLNIEYERARESVLKENDALNLRLQLIGKTEEEAKAITREATRQSKIREADAEYSIKQLEAWKKFTEIQGNTEGATFDIEGYLKAVENADRIRKEKQLLANKEVAVSAAEELAKESNRIKDGVADAIVTGLFEGGKAGKKKLRDLIVAELRKPITIFVKAVVDSVIGGTVNSLLGSATSGSGGLMGAAGNAAGSYLGSAMGLGAGGVWGTSAAYGAAIGTTSIGAGSQAAMLAAQTGEFGLAGASMTSSAAAGAGSGMASAFATAAPYIAAALALYAIYKKLDDSGTPHTGASASYSAGAGSKTGMGLYGVGSNQGYYSTDVETTMAAMSKGIVDLLDQTALSFGKTAGYEAAVAFADDSSKDGAWGSLAISKLGQELAGFGKDGNGRWPGKSFSDGEAGIKEFNNAVAADVRSALESIGLPEWASKMLKDIGDAPSMEKLGEVIGKINATQKAIESLGRVMPMFANLTSESMSSLLNAFGSVENLSSTAAGYYSNFFDDNEKAKAATEALSNEFKKLNVAVPTDRLAYRVEVEKALAEGNEELAAKLMMLSGAFAELNPWAESTGRTAQDIAANLAEMKKEGTELSIQLMTLQGKTAEANAAARLLAIEGLSELEIAAYDSNQVIRAQIAELTTKQDLDKQILELEGKKDILKQMELDKLSPANQELQKYIWSLQKAATAAEEAAAANDALVAQRTKLSDQLFQLQASEYDKQQKILADLKDSQSAAIQQQIWDVEAKQKKEAEAADKKKQLEQSAYDLETQKLQLLGDTKTLRERELALLDPSLKAAKLEIWAIQDKIEADKIAAQAAEEAARAQQQAAEEAARAAQQIKDAWKSITDSIFEEVARIRGLVTGSGSNSLAQAQANFDSASSRALAGDQEAAKSLPELSRVLLEVAGEQARSLVDLRRIQMLTAANLESVGTRINGMYGIPIPAYADGGNYAGGIALVGEQGPELINFNSGGRVYDARTSAAMMGNSNLEALVEKLNANIEGLRYEVRANVTHTSKVAKILERVSPEGDAIVVKFDTAQPVNVV